MGDPTPFCATQVEPFCFIDPEQRMTHTRIRKFNTKDTYPELKLDDDLCQAVVADLVTRPADLRVHGLGLALKPREYWP
jgi:hypothetical protein